MASEIEPHALLQDDLPCHMFAFRGSVVWNEITALLGGPLYLVGSAIHRREPFDYDVRCVLEPDDMLRLFGAEDQGGPRGMLELDGARRWRQRYLELKQSRRLSRTLKLNVDFQVQSREMFDARSDRPRLRLDAAPVWFLDAGRSRP